MASLVAKKKGNQLYYYVVESARIHGRPRIVHQAYLGTADKVAALVKDRTSPSRYLPLRATLGCPAPSGSPRSQPDWRIGWRNSGPRLDRSLRPPGISGIYCWRRFTASASPDPRPRWPTGTPRPFCIRSGQSRRHGSLRKPLGTRWRRSCRSNEIHWLAAITIHWTARKGSCWTGGRESRW
jgi:hypothetical protein